jgi:hypothetical protein
MNNKRTYKIKNIIAGLLLTAVFTNISVAQDKKGQTVFSKESPVWLDFDMETIAEPKEVETGYLYDWANGTLFLPFKNGFGLKKLFGKKEALNINTLDEVPDSSWFTNRIGQMKMSAEEIKRGANTSDGPVAGELTVLKGKNVGITPGFWVKDKSGTIYILKFDPPQYPEMASGAEIISSKLFHAIGYNVPENYIFRFRREDLKLSGKTTFTDEKWKKRAMTEADLDLILSRIARQSDGSYRALASKLIKGKPKGGFTFSGVRRDDPNDIIPHELRRDVRALRVFSAWLEHNDIRVGNTLDMFVEEGGRKFVKHYLIDFGSTLGSDSVQPNVPEVGREYRLDLNEAARVLFTAGVYQPKWRDEKSDPIVSPAVGRFSTKHFDPLRWKQNFPLAAFAEMTERDAFWAARIIARFTPEQIRAAVESAEFSNPEDADYLTEQLLRRQQMILEAVSNQRAGLGGFKLKTSERGLVLNFTDYRAQAGKYRYRLKEAGKNGEILSQGELAAPEFALTPEIVRQIQESNLEEAAELVSVAELVIDRPGEKKTTTVYLYAETAQTLRIVGIAH